MGWDRSPCWRFAAVGRLAMTWPLVLNTAAADASTTRDVAPGAKESALSTALARDALDARIIRDLDFAFLLPFLFIEPLLIPPDGGVGADGALE